MVGTEETRQIELLARRLYEAAAPILVGQPPWIQSAALADLVSHWVVGHVVVDDIVRTYELRADLLKHFEDLLHDIIPETAKQKGSAADLSRTKTNLEEGP